MGVMLYHSGVCDRVPLSSASSGFSFRYGELWGSLKTAAGGGGGPDPDLVWAQPLTPSNHPQPPAGTKFRQMLRGGDDIPEWFAFQSVVQVLREQVQAEAKA